MFSSAPDTDIDTCYSWLLMSHCGTTAKLRMGKIPPLKPCTTNVMHENRSPIESLGKREVKDHPRLDDTRCSHWRNTHNPMHTCM
jgi:hypothetical protein